MSLRVIAKVGLSRNFFYEKLFYANEMKIPWLPVPSLAFPYMALPYLACTQAFRRVVRQQPASSMGAVCLRDGSVVLLLHMRSTSSNPEPSFTARGY